jgi:hypothetical protein
MDVEEDEIVLSAAVAAAGGAFLELFGDSHADRSQNIDRGYSLGFILRKFLSLPTDEQTHQFGLNSDEFSILFPFVYESASSSASADAVLHSKDQLSCTLYWLRQYPTEESLGFLFGLSSQTVDSWIKPCVLLLCSKLSEWWGSLHPLLSPQVLQQLPAWSDFPHLKILVDSTLIPRRRPSALQSMFSFCLLLPLMFFPSSC